MSDFIPGLTLSECYYTEAVHPILDREFPGLQYAAAHIGPGSDVLGYDTPVSRDHHWGPRMLLFLREEDYAGMRAAVDEALRHSLPYSFMGYSTNFGPPDEIGVRLMREISSGPVAHMVEITTVEGFFKSYLGVTTATEVTTADWLTFSEHRLLASTSGKVFHDGPGELSRVRAALAYYPNNLWLCLLAAQWNLISEEEMFMGRAGDVGDELGSLVSAARLVRYLMRLCFLMERKYAPYSKWFGTAFLRLDCAGELSPFLQMAITGRDWKVREAALAEAYGVVAQMHNALQITRPMDTNVVNHHGRPYRVLVAERFAGEIARLVAGDRVLEAAARIGSVNQFLDATPVNENLDLLRRLKSLYQY